MLLHTVPSFAASVICLGFVAAHILLMRFESFLADGCVLDSWICFHLSWIFHSFWGE
jgi:hypothetical protein